MNNGLADRSSGSAMSGVTGRFVPGVPVGRSKREAGGSATRWAGTGLVRIIPLAWSLNEIGPCGLWGGRAESRLRRASRPGLVHRMVARRVIPMRAIYGCCGELAMWSGGGRFRSAGERRADVGEAGRDYGHRKRDSALVTAVWRSVTRNTITYRCGMDEPRWLDSRLRWLGTGILDWARLLVLEGYYSLGLRLTWLVL